MHNYIVCVCVRERERERERKREFSCPYLFSICKENNLFSKD